MADNGGSTGQEDTSAYLPTEGIIGLAVGLPVVVGLVVLIVYCRKRQEKKSLKHGHVLRRTPTEKRSGLHNISYSRKENDEPRESGTSFEDSGTLDASAFRVRTSEQRDSIPYPYTGTTGNRISYDRPYTTEFDHYASVDRASAWITPDSNADRPPAPLPNTSLPETKNMTSQPQVVSNYGEVRMMSKGGWTDSMIESGLPQNDVTQNGGTHYQQSQTGTLMRRKDTDTKPAQKWSSPRLVHRPISVPSRPTSDQRQSNRSSAFFPSPQDSIPAGRHSLIRAKPVNNVSHASPIRPTTVSTGQQFTLSAADLAHNPYASSTPQKPHVQSLSLLKTEEPLYSTVNRVPAGAGPVNRVPAGAVTVNRVPAGAVVVTRRPSQKAPQHVQRSSNDSFRDSNAVDLGAEASKAWMIAGYQRQGTHPQHDFML